MQNEPHAGVGIKRFTYEAVPPEGALVDLDKAVSAFMGLKSAVVARVSDKGTKEVDIRPMVEDVSVSEGGLVRFTLRESDGKSAKPYELVQALFKLTPQESKSVRIKRTWMGV